MQEYLPDIKIENKHCIIVYEAAIQIKKKLLTVAFQKTHIHAVRQGVKRQKIKGVQRYQRDRQKSEDRQDMANKMKRKNRKRKKTKRPDKRRPAF